MIYDKATTPAKENQPGLIALRKVCIEHFKVGDYGILSKRKVRGGNDLSVHSEGRAWDAKCDVFTEKDKGDRLADFLWNNKDKLGVQKIVWNNQVISSLDPNWQQYTGQNKHTNHLHIELTKQTATIKPLTVKDVRDALEV